METNNIKASRIKAAGKNFSNIGYTMILVFVISLGQFFYNKKISEQSQSISRAENKQQIAKDRETASKDLETANYAASVLYFLCSIIILVNFISAGKNLSSCEELEAKAHVIPNVDSEKLLSKLNMTKSNSGKLADGGIIVYAHTNGLHGLVCSISDLGIGDWNSAKQLCDNYNEGGFSDWRLPTKDELQFIYLLLHRRKICGFANSHYWSSTEEDDNYAFRQNFNNGNTFYFSKGYESKVRAVRVF